MTTRTPDAERTTEELIAYVEDRVETLRDRYRARARWHARFFRSSGILVIGMASALPVLASFSYRHKDWVVAIIGAVIAFLTALRSFYQWDQLWGLLRQADLAISHLLDEWTVGLAAAEVLPADDRPAEVERLAKKLLDDTEAIRAAESHSYFAMLRWADVSGSESKQESKQ
jgi:ABC-type multidrug transport system fused ATPase/permease subunit